MEIVLLGHMGRDEAIADRLEGHTLHVLGQWRNPGLVEKAETSGGRFHVVKSITDTQHIADLVQAIEPDMFLTNFDDALAAGVVDAVKQRVADKRMGAVLVPSPDQASARVEWDKFYLRELIDEIDPAYNPANFMVESEQEAEKAIDLFEARGIEMALKPRNPTGGKGVKVQGKHFDTYQRARQYARQILWDPHQSGLEVQERLDGHEFTLQIFTDGTRFIRPPATYDYPYREDGDEGPGTGGMGAFSMQAEEQLPFITPEDYDETLVLMDKLLMALRNKGHDYKGVLYPTFFKTPEGLKIVEVNARGGDPELVNITDLMEDDVDLAEVLRSIALGELTPDSVRYKKLASAMIYLVSPDYCYRKGPTYKFSMDTHVVESHGCQVRFAAAEQTGENAYCTVAASRIVGISALGGTPWAARGKLQAAIEAGIEQPLPFHYRRQIAEKAYIEGLAV